MGKSRLHCFRRPLVSILLVLGFNSLSFTQNLVPNPSFEEYNELHCGNTVDVSDFNNASVNWTTPTTGTPELYSKLVDIGCGNHPLGKTQQAAGSQEPKDGDFMVGLITYTERRMGGCNDYSEYVQVKLKEPLVIGTTYHVGLFASLADNREFASNNFGMLFTKSPIGSDTCDFIDVKPQFNSTRVITDSQGWKFVNGSFTANSADEYLTVGNFFSDEKTRIEYLQDNPIFSSGISYYFIDSVFVEPIKRLDVPNVFTPNNDSYNQKFVIDNLQEDRWILTITNRWGQKVFESKYYDNQWEGQGLSSGVYYYHLIHRYVNIEYKGTITIMA